MNDEVVSVTQYRRRRFDSVERYDEELRETSVTTRGGATSFVFCLSRSLRGVRLAHWAATSELVSSPLLPNEVWIDDLIG
jgi:hypothetical protein